jgi:exodeoxyribonuclease-3
LRPPFRAASTVGLILFNAQTAAPGRARRQAAWENANLVIATEVGAGPGGQILIAALASAFFGAGLRASHT